MFKVTIQAQVEKYTVIIVIIDIYHVNFRIVAGFLSDFIQVFKILFLKSVTGKFR